MDRKYDSSNRDNSLGGLEVFFLYIIYLSFLIEFVVLVHLSRNSVSYLYMFCGFFGGASPSAPFSS